jgi:SAM-dependent methyltransferase
MTMASPIGIKAKLLKHSMKPCLTKGYIAAKGDKHCYACGSDVTEWVFSEVINDELASTWDLTPELIHSFNLRESMLCPNCSSSFRLRLLAESMSIIYGGGMSLKEMISNNSLDGIDVAEINSCGNLHQFLGQIPGIAYSEYGSKNKDVRSEDLKRLSYENKEFDLVLTSDTLEHVPDFKAALSEIHRVLKPGGMHIFTIRWYGTGLRDNELQSKVKRLLIYSRLHITAPVNLII